MQKQCDGCDANAKASCHLPSKGRVARPFSASASLPKSVLPDGWWRGHELPRRTEDGPGLLILPCEGKARSCCLCLQGSPTVLARPGMNILRPGQRVPRVPNE